jgi:ubiquinone/menaquinone biosynthesis C-methylase UbiE
MSTETDKPQQVWNDQGAHSWARLQDRTDAQLEVLGLAVIERVMPLPGERVLDVGCGAGQTLLQLAERVGTHGRVVGVDISEPLLARARERVQQARFEQVEIVLGDAATQRFESAFDIVFSRFGVMFFEEPVAAFQNLRAALRPGGRLGFVCWQPMEKNPWVALPFAALRRLAPDQPLPALLEPGKSGPFAFSDPNLVRSILEKAGFDEVTIEPREFRSLLGGARTLDEAVEFSLEIGPCARFVSEAEPELAPALKAALREALAPFESERGMLVSFQAFLVTASGGSERRTSDETTVKS